MTLWEIIGSGSAGIFILLTIIQISPLKVNPWGWIARQVGKAINGELTEKVEAVEKEVKELRQECDEREATASRTAILRFCDEILLKQKHSKEHFDQILTQITKYQNYCEAHPSYKNNIAEHAIRKIEETYDECLDKGTFL